MSGDLKGVDGIVSVRGETAELFEGAYRFIESLDISQLHVCTDSERPGTMALKIDYVVDPKEKHKRSQRILELSEKKLRDFYTSQIGKTHKVLFEQPSKGQDMHGFTENYIRIEAPLNKTLVNEAVDVKAGNFNEAGDSLIAEIEDLYEQSFIHHFKRYIVSGGIIALRCAI